MKNIAGKRYMATLSPQQLDTRHRHLKEIKENSFQVLVRLTVFLSTLS